MVSTSLAPKAKSTATDPSGAANDSAGQSRMLSNATEHPMKLSMISIEKGGLILVAAEGNITAADVDPTAANPLQTLLGVTWSSNRVLLNLEQSGYVDSSAIGWLMHTQRAFKEAGGQLVVFNVQPAVRQLLDILKIGRILPIADDEATARKLVAEGGAK